MEKNTKRSKLSENSELINAPEPSVANKTWLRPQFLEALVDPDHERLIVQLCFVGIEGNLVQIEILVLCHWPVPKPCPIDMKHRRRFPPLQLSGLRCQRKSRLQLLAIRVLNES